MISSDIKISVIMPAYNTADCIEETIKSVLAQTNINFELIIIDDCSTDDTYKLIMSFQSDKIVYVKNEKNIGQSRSRNTGIKLAKGKYIAFLDSDDLYANSSVLERWHQLAEKNSSDLTRCSYASFKDGTNKLKVSRNFFTNKTIESTTLNETPALLNNSSCWLFLYNRDYLIENSIFFSEDLRQREDRVFFTLALLLAKSVSCFDENFISYRVRANSTMRTTNPAQVKMFAKHMDIVSDYLNNYSASTDVCLLSEVKYCLLTLTYWSKEFNSNDYFNEHREVGIEYFQSLKELTTSDQSFLDEIHLTKTKYEINNLLEAEALRFIVRYCEYDDFINYLVKRELSFASFKKITINNKVHESIELFNFLQRTVSIPSAPLELDNDITYIIHIGMTKTGSSSLQKIFEHFRFQLLENDGVYYPVTGLENGKGLRNNRTSGHARLINGISNCDMKIFHQLNNEISLLQVKPHTVFISAENILSYRYWDNGQVIDKISKVFKGQNIKILGYFREQSNWLESIYVELIESPGFLCHQNIRSFLNRKETLGLLDYYKIYNDFLTYFDKSQLIFKIYENCLNKGGTVTDVFKLLNIKNDYKDITQENEKLKNKSLSTEVAFIKRYLNQMNFNRSNLISFTQELNENFLKEGKSDEKFISSLLKDEIHKKFKQSNSLFTGALLNDANYYEVFNAAPAKALSSIEDNGTLKVSLINKSLQFIIDEKFSSFSNKKYASMPKSADLKINVLRKLNTIIGLVKMLIKDRGLERIRQVLLLKWHKSIDCTYYMENNVFSKNSTSDIYIHYVNHWKSSGEPNKYFDTEAYLKLTPDLDMPPLVHYILNK